MQCSEAQSKITLFLDDMLTLEEKSELAQHIRSCPGCREELEFYYAVYDTIGKFDDRMLSGDYAAHVEDLLRQTERERQAALKISRWRRFRLLTGCLAIAALMSIGLRGTLMRSRLIQTAVATYDTDGTLLPGKMELTCGIMPHIGEERLFEERQQMRELLRGNMYTQDAVIMHVLKPEAVLEYAVSEQLMSGAVLTREGLDRRLAMEDAAGVVQYSSMREESCKIRLSAPKH